MSAIDVVIPCYRYGHYLRECVNSVLTQGIADLRILILDDESPDDTPAIATAIAREHPCVTYWRHASNRGHIATFNEGIEWCTADYMLLLSADDYLLPGALKRAIDLMDQHPEVGLCFGESLESHPDGSQRLIRIDTAPSDADSMVVSGPQFIDMVVRAGSTNIVPTPTAIVKTRLLKLLGGYRPALTHSGDLEMWLRLAAHASVGIVHQEQAVYRRHASNMSHAYYADYDLKDLQQRKAAFDVFLESCRDANPEVPGLYQRLLPPLAREAIGNASSAFNANRMDLSHQLRDFALSVDPDVRQTMAWKRLAIKRLLGHRLSTALVSRLTRIRSFMSRVRSPLPHESAESV